MKELSVLEQMIMSAILSLKENAYGVSIRQRVTETTRKRLMYGTLYNTLDQLVRKRYVTKSRGEPTSERGGRSKIYYRISPEGLHALRAAYELQKSIWDGIPEFVSEGDS